MDKKPPQIDYCDNRGIFKEIVEFLEGFAKQAPEWPRLGYDEGDCSIVFRVCPGSECGYKDRDEDINRMIGLLKERFGNSMKNERNPFGKLKPTEFSYYVDSNAIHIGTVHSQRDMTPEEAKKWREDWERGSAQFAQRYSGK